MYNTSPKKPTCAAFIPSDSGPRYWGSNFLKLVKMKTAIKRVMTSLYWLYYQYKLITCSDLMVPCEKFVFYTVIVPMTAAVMYMIYIFITVQINLAFQVFLLLFGSLPESAVSIMK